MKFDPVTIRRLGAELDAVPGIVPGTELGGTGVSSGGYDPTAVVLPPNLLPPGHTRTTVPEGVEMSAWVATCSYLARGWKLFLLPGDGDKVPVGNCDDCRGAGPEHDKEACPCLLCHGFYAATADPRRLAAMWNRVRGGVLAVRTGSASGIVVVDAEGPPDDADRARGVDDTSGVEVLDAWEEWTGGFPLPATLRARTPSGGVHLFYATGDDDIIRTAARVLPGVDVRGRGGYAVLPPGVAGERSWITGPGMPTDPQPPGPAMLAWLRAARGRRGRTDPGMPAPASAGEREAREHGVYAGADGNGGPRARWKGYDFTRMVKEGPPRGVQDDFLNDLVFRMVRHDGMTDPELILARVWPMVSAWDQDGRRPWTRLHVTRKITHVLDSVSPPDALPEWTPRREEQGEVTVRWDGPTRFPDVSPVRSKGPDPLDSLQSLPSLPSPQTDGAEGTEGITEAPGAGEGSASASVSEAGAAAAAGAAAHRDGGEGVVIPVDFGVGAHAHAGGPGTGTSAGGGAPGRPGYGGPTGDGVPGTEGMHDTGNANRMVRLHGENLRWLEDEGVWLVWEGSRWRRDRTRTVEGWTIDVMTDLARHARDVGGEEGKLWVRHMRASYAAGRRTAMLLNTQRVPGVTVTSQMLDTDPWSLVVANGVLDLRTGQLGQGRREDLNTRCAAVAFDPAAQAPLWEAHVRTVTGGDEVMARYLRRLAGYCLTGLTSEQAFFSLEGSGDNGKNAFIEPLMLLMGEYADPGDSRLVTSGETHAAIVASLVGQRLVFVDEIPAGRRMDVERVKTLTGSKRMKAQFMAKDWFAFTPQVKLWIAGNAQPPIKDTSDGIWRRMHRIVFDAKIPEGAKVKDYSTVLFRREGPGILNWALAGLAEWVATGRLGMPEAVREAVQELREDSDHVGSFLADCVEVTGVMAARTAAPTAHGRLGAHAEWEWSGDWIPNSRLQAVYTAWCDGQGVAPRERVNAVHLGRRVTALGAVRYRDHRDGSQGRGLDGARLTVSAVQLWGAVL